MKKIISIKHVDHVQLGHLYEHIVCMRVAEYFRSHGLFAYVDYFVNAKTYYSGVVLVELHLYTKRALPYVSILETIDIDLDEAAVSGAMLQIMAEKYADVAYYDQDSVIATLQKYHEAPWRIMNDSFSHDTESHVLHTDYFGLSPRSPRQFLQLRQDIRLEARDCDMVLETLLPLFAVVSKALGDSLREDIADSSYCYSYDDVFTHNAKQLRATNYYRIDKRQATSLTHEADIARRLSEIMVQSGWVERLASYLQHASMERPLEAPDEQLILEHTGLVVGVQDWRRMGTFDNIRRILLHTSIDFRLNGTKQTVHLREFLS